MTKNIAVLFDLDGTLLDTERYWYRSFEKIAGDNGYRWTPSDSLHTVGANVVKAIRYLKEKANIDSPDLVVAQQLIQNTSDLYTSEGIPWLEGSYQLLEELAKAQIPTAVVSNSPLNLVEQVQAIAPKGALSVLVTGDIPNLAGKPAPDPYLYAAEKLGVDIKDCLVFEDSATGITAAVRSGAKAVLLGDFTKIEQLDSDVREVLLDPEKGGRSPGLYDWDLSKILDFLSHGK